MKLLPIFMIPALFCSTAVRADFAMLPPPPQAPTAATALAPPADSSPALPAPPVATPIALHPAASSSDRPARKANEHTPQIALGFGEQIPLSFAVRQIVPQTVTLHFSRAADRDALVDWHGGRRWPSVLRDAIRPLGLRLSVRHHKAIIFKAQND